MAVVYSAATSSHGTILRLLTISLYLLRTCGPPGIHRFSGTLATELAKPGRAPLIAGRLIHTNNGVASEFLHIVASVVVVDVCVTSFIVSSPRVVTRSSRVRRNIGTMRRLRHHTPYT